MRLYDNKVSKINLLSLSTKQHIYVEEDFFVGIFQKQIKSPKINVNKI